MPRVSMRGVLIEAGQKVLHERGYAATAVQDIAAVAGVPKGSFFNHFGTKEAFASLALERYVAESEVALTALFDDDSRPILERIVLLVDRLKARVMASDARTGCMVGNLSIEVSGSSEPLRQQLSEAFARWRAPMTEALKRAQARGEIALRVTPEVMANFIQNGLQGAMLRAKVDRTSESIDQFKAVLTGYLSD